MKLDSIIRLTNISTCLAIPDIRWVVAYSINSVGLLRLKSILSCQVIVIIKFDI